MQELLRTAYLSLVLAAATLVSTGFAQSSTASHQHGEPTSASAPDLGAQLRQLQTQVAELEAALSVQHRERYETPQHRIRMGMMSGMDKTQTTSDDMDSAGMGMMGDGMGMAMMDGGMKGMGMMSMKKGKKGMMGMGMMGMGMMGMNPAMSSDSMAGMNMPSALPGFPGASHLYHIGETGFFLDHPEHITLTDEQQKKLNEIKESALLATATAERKVAEAEQDLWKLTAAAEPDIKKIEAKTREIAQLQVENRIAFIRAVGKAAEVLAKEQRETLVGESAH